MDTCTILQVIFDSYWSEFFAFLFAVFIPAPKLRKLLCRGDKS